MRRGTGFFAIDPPAGKFLVGKESPLKVMINSPKQERICVEYFARCFKRELKYDFLQYSAKENPWAEKDYKPYEAWLFNEDAPDLYDLGESEIRRAVGACCFRNMCGIGAAKDWMLEWVWFHPWRRRSGLLKATWPQFVEAYGVFGIEKPYSLSMEAFLNTVGSQQE